MRGQFTRRSLLQLAATGSIGTAALGGESAVTARSPAAGGERPPGTGAAGGDGDAGWYSREFRNYAKTQEAPVEQAADPGFMRRWQRRSAANGSSYAERVAAEPGWRSHANACATWGQQCTGDPSLYRDVDARDFYGTVGERRRVAFYDRQGARLSGHLWYPVTGSDRPGVVVTNGSVQAPEPLYWWAAQSLVDAGYVVLTYDPRGQGRSDSVTPGGDRGGNADGEVFVTNQVDAIDFFRSTPAEPYPPNVDEGFRRADDDEAPVHGHNPLHDRLDRDRLGIAGHSAGAIGASVVQGLEPWPTGGENPVDVVVAWDNLGDSGDVGGDGPEGTGSDVAEFLQAVPGGDVEPRVPAMGQSADYFLTPRPHERPPDPDAKASGYRRWRAADVPAYQLVVRGGTHYEWSRVPTYPATSWEFGNAFADHYTVAWFDRWLKQPGEAGYHDADDRLLADDEWADHCSFHYRSKRAFPDRRQQFHECDDIGAGCDDGTSPGR